MPRPYRLSLRPRSVVEDTASVRVYVCLVATLQEAVDLYLEAVNKLPSHYAPQSLYNMLGIQLSLSLLLTYFAVEYFLVCYEIISLKM